MSETLDFWIFSFSTIVPYYQNSLSSCFGDNTTDVKTNIFISDPIPTQISSKTFLLKLFNKKVNLFCCWAWSNISTPDLFRSYRSMEISTVQKSRQCLLQQSFNFCNILIYIYISIYIYNWNLFKNRWKLNSVEMFLGVFSAAFRTGAINNAQVVASKVFVSRAVVFRISAEYLGKQL